MNTEYKKDFMVIKRFFTYKIIEAVQILFKTVIKSSVCFWRHSNVNFDKCLQMILIVTSDKYLSKIELLILSYRWGDFFFSYFPKINRLNEQPTQFQPP